MDKAPPKEIMVEVVKHEATAVLGPIHSSHSWYVETHEFPSALYLTCFKPATLDTTASRQSK